MYSLSMGRNPPSGAGSQFAAAAGSAGRSRLMRRVSDPSSPRTIPGVRSPIEYRPAGLATRK